MAVADSEGVELARPSSEAGMISDHKPSLGLTLAFLSAALYAATTLCASVAYGEGANPGTVVWLRFAVSALALGLAALVLRRSFRIERGGLLPLLGTAFGTLGMSVGYLSSVAYIPISLAVLIFYTFPLLVGTAEALLDRKPIRPVSLIYYIMAFGGLVLALGPEFHDLDWRGIAFASLASASAVLALLSSRVMVRRVEPLAAACLTNVVNVVIMSLLLPFLGGVALPASGLGWGLVAVACLAFVVAYALQILSVRYAAAGAVAMMYNFEPAVTVLAAWALFDALLSGGQWLGVGLILAALFLFSLPSRR